MPSLRNHLTRVSTQRWQAIVNNSFIRSVSILVGGTAFAQAVTVFMLPILTRLYSPEDFSLLAVYAAMLAIIAVIGCLRLDIAIPLPEKDEDAASLLVWALLFSGLIGGMSALIVILWPGELAQLIGQPKMQPYLWLLPLGIWMASSYSALLYWTTRKKNFPIVSKTRMTQSLMGSGTQVGAAFVGLAPQGLLMGHLILSGAGVVGLARAAWKQSAQTILSVSWRNMRAQIKAYKTFPQYSTLESLANNTAMQLPIVVIGAISVGAEAGYLLLAIRIMAAPMALMGGAVAQVYLSRASEEYRAGNLGKFTSDVVHGLMRVGIGPLIFVGIVAPLMFPLLFGLEWNRAGEIVVWITPWITLQFLASPISMSMYVRGWQKRMLALTVLGLAIRLGAIYAAILLGGEVLVEFYAVSSAIFYALCLLVFFKCAQVRMVDFASGIFPILGVIFCWIVLGISLVGLCEIIL